MPLRSCRGFSPVYKVRRILDMRRRGRGHQYLVDWKGYGPEERSWVPSRDILDRSIIDDFLRSRQVPPSGGAGDATALYEETGGLPADLPEFLLHIRLRARAVRELLFLLEDFPMESVLFTFLKNFLLHNLQASCVPV